MNELFSKEDMEQNKLKAGLGYIVFFVPLIFCKGSKLGRYCANQGLLLLIASILVSLLLGIFEVIPLLGWLFKLVSGLVRFAFLLIGILCFLQLTTHERALEIPIIGGLRIID